MAILALSIVSTGYVSVLYQLDDQGAFRCRGHNLAGDSVETTLSLSGDQNHATLRLIPARGSAWPDEETRLSDFGGIVIDVSGEGEWIYWGQHPAPPAAGEVSFETPISVESSHEILLKYRDLRNAAPDSEGIVSLDCERIARTDGDAETAIFETGFSQ